MSQEISGYVWYSQKSHYRGISYTTMQNMHGSVSNLEPEVLETMKLATMQQFLTADQLPADLYHNKRRGAPRPKRHPDMFASGFMILSSKAADIVKQFDLGEGALYPVRLWENDAKTRVPGDFFYLTHGNRKTGFLPEKSPEAFDPYGNKKVWLPPPNPVNDQLYFSREALEGVDIWRDNKCYFGIMLSDRLVSTLKDAGIARDWKLLRCPVIEG